MISHALRARRFFPLANRRQRAVQAVRYAKAIEYLGDKWLLKQPAQKLAQVRPV